MVKKPQVELIQNRKNFNRKLLSYSDRQGLYFGDAFSRQ